MNDHALAILVGILSLVLLFPWLCFVFAPAFAIYLFCKGYSKRKSSVWRSLNGVENLFFNLSTPSRDQLMHGYIALESPLEFEDFRALIERMVEHQPKLKQRVKPSASFSHLHQFEQEDHFDISDHIHTMTVRHAGTQEDIKEAVGYIMSLPLPPHEALWQAWLLQNCDGGSGIVLRLHHAVCDGFSGNLLLLSLMTTKDGSSPLPTLVSSSSPRAVKKPNPVVSFFSSLFKYLVLPFYNLYLVAYNQTVSSFPSTMLKELMRRDHPAVDSDRKVVCWTTPMLLEDFKQIKNTFGVTINDVFLTIIGGSIRRVAAAAAEKNDIIPSEALCQIPVSVRRSLDVNAQIGNQVSGTCMILPLALEDPLQRLHMLSKEMSFWKRFPFYISFNYIFMHIFGAFPASWVRTMFGFYSDRALAILTNVPGPQKQMYVADIPVRAILAFGLESSNGGISVAMVSYQNHVVISVGGDEEYIGNTAGSQQQQLPQRIVEYIQDEFQQLLHAAAERQVEQAL